MLVMEKIMKNDQDCHGGNLEQVTKKLGIEGVNQIKYDFSVNLNPAGMPTEVEKFIVGVDGANCIEYPEVYAKNAVKSLAVAHSVSSDQVLFGNGATEIFLWIVQALKPKLVNCVAPCYSGYGEVCEAAGVDYEYVISTSPEDDFSIDIDRIAALKADLIFMATPNNPTGMVVEEAKIIELAKRAKDKYFVLDISFCDFLNQNIYSGLFSEDIPENLILVKSLTKFFSVAGLRVGMSYASDNMTKRIKKHCLPWSANVLAQSIAPLLYKNTDEINESRSKVAELRKDFFNELSLVKQLKVFPGQANFLLCQILDDKWDANKLQRELLQQGVMIRSCANFYGLGDKFIRLAVRSEKDNKFLVSCIKELFEIKLSNSDQIESKRAKAVMVVGTTSDSGKSLVAATLCRYFLRNKFSVAPFKAQNMALNSFVTEDGREMGRAQVVQAEAAKVIPHTDMNPVLLKPCGNTTSQLIVNGKATGTYSAREYYQQKKSVRFEAHKAYERLAAKYDVIVLEGAGSPAEINLMKEDFVNMAMADYAEANTILVADIERGGVFASIFGTIKMIPAKYRKLISGIIINKFRGDVSLLDQGIKDIEKMTGVPVIGVLPYLKDIQLEEEDSLGLEKARRKAEQKEDAILDIVVIRIPRLSNYTDFLEFENTAKVKVRYIDKPEQIGDPDLIFIPGTKNTTKDMEFILNSGLDKAIKLVVESGTPLIGICGGYQMLGKYIHDPEGVEADIEKIEGLGFFNQETIMNKEKELAQVTGYTTEFYPFAPEGTYFKGYEIHSGRTANLSSESKENPLVIDKRRGGKCEEQAGYLSEENGLVFGSYVHGIFDDEKMRTSLLEWLCRKKNIEIPADGFISEYERDSIYEGLADLIEKHIDTEKLDSWVK